MVLHGALYIRKDCVGLNDDLFEAMPIFSSTHVRVLIDQYLKKIIHNPKADGPLINGP